MANDETKFQTCHALLNAAANRELEVFKLIRKLWENQSDSSKVDLTDYQERLLKLALKDS